MKKRYIVLITILGLLVIIRLMLPYIAKQQINKALANIEGYHGSINDLSMSLYKGAFNIGDLVIYEEASEDPETPFIILPILDFSIDWRALLKGRFVAEIEMDSLEVNLTVLKEEEKKNEPRIRFAEQLQEFNPVQINNLKITNAKISYLDPTVDPKVDVYFDGFNLIGENLSNVEDEEKVLPGYIKIDSKAMGEGSMVMEMHVNILKEIPDFDLNLAFEEIDLVKFNSFMEAYANLELKSGILSVFTELIVNNGEINGYLKPVIENFEVNQEAEDRNLPEKVYDAVVNLVGKVLENPKEEQIASRVELSGHVENIENDPWQAVFGLLRNAFIEAYSKEIENSINFGSSGSGGKGK
ncbi:DUF748 domain-containing protein [Aquiflexum sp. TKW24L]|uniref:DUF748 domain-containing protein n=1 Tax=Aquiflexum sp. TKW24L TaxID=2942212 RepID=UPI0020BDCDB3|nr:DUF748 domain-containing protein [Aquiflexum sp. TKW24L]MCL6258411.1 DUF748 domain-containing protein [Aquiflexum sp. TKW24L]